MKETFFLFNHLILCSYASFDSSSKTTQYYEEHLDDELNLPSNRSELKRKEN